MFVHEGQRPDFSPRARRRFGRVLLQQPRWETTLSFLPAPGAFILAAVVLDQLYLKSARTTESSVVVLIPAEAVRGVFNKDPAFARAIVADAGA